MKNHTRLGRQSLVAVLLLMTPGLSVAQKSTAPDPAGGQSTTARPRIFCHGLSDSFACPEETAVRSVPMLEFFARSQNMAYDSTVARCWDFLDFDEIPSSTDCDTGVFPANAYFVHRITHTLPGSFYLPRIQWRAKAAASGETAYDFVAFFHEGQFITSAGLRSLPGAGGLWDPGQVTDFVFDLSNLPPAFTVTDISGYLFAGSLDIVVGTHTGVDYICLTYPHRISIDRGWNIVANVDPAPRHRMDLFPTAVSGAFGFDDGYVARDTLVPGHAYWMRFADGGDLNVDAEGIDSLTITVSAGWNMVAPGLDESVESPLITPTGTAFASLFFIYDSGYKPLDPDSIIKPGVGAWVKMSADGAITIVDGAGSGPSPLTASRRAVDELTKELNAIEFSDKAGVVQKLYFGSRPTHDVSPILGELPPLPPAGAFDIRFRSGKFIEFIPDDDDDPIELPIEHSIGAFPLTVTPLLRKDSGRMFSLTVLRDGKPSASYALEQGKVLKLYDTKATGLVLQSATSVSLPERFALHQNFPNPFNPATSIKYEVPSESRVKLTVFNALGAVVGVLVDEIQVAGYRTFEWDASAIPSGVYFVRMSAVDVANPARAYSEMRKALLVR